MPEDTKDLTYQEALDATLTAINKLAQAFAEIATEVWQAVCEVLAPVFELVNQARLQIRHYLRRYEFMPPRITTRHISQRVRHRSL